MSLVAPLPAGSVLRVGGLRLPLPAGGTLRMGGYSMLRRRLGMYSGTGAGLCPLAPLSVSPLADRLGSVGGDMAQGACGQVRGPSRQAGPQPRRSPLEHPAPRLLAAGCETSCATSGRARASICSCRGGRAEAVRPDTGRPLKPMQRCLGAGTVTGGGRRCRTGKDIWGAAAAAPRGGAGYAWQTEYARPSVAPGAVVSHRNLLLRTVTGTAVHRDASRPEALSTDTCIDA